MCKVSADTCRVDLGSAYVLIVDVVVALVMEIIQIRAGAKRNGFSLCLFGIAGLFLSALWLMWLPDWLKLAGIFLTSASLVTILIGWLKVREPVFSFELTRKELKYLHRFGSWRLEWSNIQRVGIPRVRRGLTHQDMELVGIRLKDYEPLLAVISPRLASNILMQQRPLLLQGEDCQTGQCYSETLLEKDRFKGASGKEYRGIVAMFANRMIRIREVLGYDLFVFASELDRSQEEFVALLNACQQQAVNQ
ncbi:hypothetical protein GCM10010982_07340 [Bowmanella pacifica]|uniref:DUF2982 domain-containing protein n=1 Tax=Bowmanella pacifica TaxID=502051 RepID=A0A917YTY8_9ALTE|nr:hypothetical protein GCM10010982_07340 [Bowmanella pacifica]